MNSAKPAFERKGVLVESKVGFSYTVGVDGFLKVGDDRVDGSEDVKIITHGNDAGA